MKEFEAGGLTPRILNLGNTRSSDLGGCVGPNVSLKTLREVQIFCPLSAIEPRFSGRPARSLVMPTPS
jgi:hypothetical protein